MDRSGKISVEELCAGLNKIGITTRLEEAIALANSVSKDGDMGAKQFQELLFSTNEQLDIDLDQI